MTGPNPKPPGSPNPPNPPQDLNNVQALAEQLQRSIYQILQRADFVPNTSPAAQRAMARKLGRLLDQERWTSDDTITLSALFFVMTLISEFEASRGHS